MIYLQKIKHVSDHRSDPFTVVLSQSFELIKYRLLSFHKIMNLHLTFVCTFIFIQLVLGEVFHGLMRFRSPQTGHLRYLAVENNMLVIKDEISYSTDVHYEFFIQTLHSRFIGVLTLEGPKYLQFSLDAGALKVSLVDKSIRNPPSSFFIHRLLNNRCIMAVRICNAVKPIGLSDSEFVLGEHRPLDERTYEDGNFHIELIRTGVSDVGEDGFTADPLPFYGNQLGSIRVLTDNIFLSRRSRVTPPSVDIFTMYLRRGSMFEDFVKETNTVFLYLRNLRAEYEYSQRYNVKAMIEDEDGLDLGGVIVDVMSEVGKKFFDPKLGLLERFSDGGHYVTGDKVNSEILYAFGAFLSISFDLNIPLPYKMTRTSFEWLAYLSEAIQRYLREDFSFKMTLPDSDLDKEKAEYSSILKIDQDVEIEEDGRVFLFTPDNVDRMLDKYVSFKFLIAPKQNWIAIRDGYGMPSSYLMDASTFEESLNPTEEISLDIWKAVTKYDNGEETSPQVEWFWKFLELHSEFKKNTLRFITGRESWNEKMLEDFSMRINIVNVESDLSLPVSHTWYGIMTFIF